MNPIIWKFALSVVPLAQKMRTLIREARKNQEASKEKKGVTFRLDQYQWIEKQVENGRFWNFSHAVQVAVDKLRGSKRESKT